MVENLHLLSIKTEYGQMILCAVSFSRGGWFEDHDSKLIFKIIRWFFAVIKFNHICERYFVCKLAVPGFLLVGGFQALGLGGFVL